MKRTSTKAYLGKTVVTILDSKWAVYFHSDKQYQKLGIKGSRAACVVQGRNKAMHFNCAATFPGDGVVTHEFVHAYSHELMGHDLTLSPDEKEEFFCTLFEMRGQELLKKAKPIYALLMKYAKQAARLQPNQEEEDGE